MEGDKEKPMERGEEVQKENIDESPSSMALNHVSSLCKSLDASIDFYEKVLGFVLIKHPEAFNFDGAW